MRSVCALLGRRGWRGGLVDERIGFELYQSCGNRGSVGCVSVFGLRWCGLEVGSCLGPGSGGLAWCYVCVSCESGFFA